ncbi:MAG: YigZ family protein [Cyclobacteriaceae bacterium]
MEYYYTIAAPSEGTYKEKGSRFLAFAFPVESEEDVKDQLDGLRKQFYDARHHCYAYILEPDASKYRANDDGEPNHSAGDPILGQIRSQKLTNVLVVVVRYFGGTKLGVSGLINAYKTAAQNAINGAKRLKIIIREPIQIDFPYEKTSVVMRLVDEYQIIIKNQSFTASCLIDGEIQPSKLVAFEKIAKLEGINFKIGADQNET